LGYECGGLYQYLGVPRVLTAERLDRDCNFRVLARILRIGEIDFSSSCNFKELRIAKRSYLQLLRYTPDFDPFAARVRDAPLYIIRGGPDICDGISIGNRNADAADAAGLAPRVRGIEIIVPCRAMPDTTLRAYSYCSNRNSMLVKPTRAARYRVAVSFIGPLQMPGSPAPASAITIKFRHQ
jgi:hypothetical protein